VLLAAVPLGYLADRYRRTTILGVFALVWSAATVFSGLVTSSWQLFAGRIASGIGKATEGPVQKSLLADAYPIAGRSRVFALHGMANPIGFAVTPLVAGGVTVLVGGPEAWRWAFFVVAAPGILLGLYALVQREPQRGKHELESVLGVEAAEAAAEEELRVPLGAAFVRLKQVRTFYYLLSALGALGFGFVTLPVYLNLILEEDFGLGTGGRTVVAVVTGLGGIIGVIIGGRYGDRLFRRDPELSMRLIALGVGSFGLTVPVQVYSRRSSCSWSSASCRAQPPPQPSSPRTPSSPRCAHTGCARSASPSSASTSCSSAGSAAP
jgi:MFS family permease